MLLLLLLLPKTFYCNDNNITEITEFEMIAK